MAKKKMSAKAEAMLDAHVAFVCEQLTGDDFESLVEEHVDAVLKDMRKLKLGDVVSAQQVRETAHFYASEMEIAAGIPELVGEISREVYNHPGHDNTRLEDLLRNKRFREFAKKVSEMKSLRERIIRESVNNPMYADLIGDVLYHGIKNYLSENPLTKRIPGAASMMKLGKSMMDMTNVEESLKKYINHNIKSSLRESERFLLNHLSDKALYELIDDVWNKIKHQRVSLFRDYVSETDVEEAYVIGFDYWRELRETDYYKGLIDAGIDFFFRKYSATPLLELLEEFGIERDMIVTEVMRYAPHALAALKQKKLLDGVVRRGLEPFYRSEAAAQLLGD